MGTITNILTFVSLYHCLFFTLWAIFPVFPVFRNIYQISIFDEHFESYEYFNELLDKIFQFSDFSGRMGFFIVVDCDFLQFLFGVFASWELERLYSIYLCKSITQHCDQKNEIKNKVGHV